MKKAAVVIWSILGFVIVSFGLLMLVGTEEPKETAAEAETLNFNQKEYNELEKELIAEGNGSIIKIERNGRLFDVTLHDDWHKLEIQEKEKFAATIYNKIRGMAIQSELINTNANLDVMLLDSAGKEIAEKKTFSNEWEIK